MTKGMAAMLVYTTKDCNYNSIVIIHQQGGYDVTCKPRIMETVTVLIREIKDHMQVNFRQTAEIISQLNFSMEYM